MNAVRFSDGVNICLQRSKFFLSVGATIGRPRAFNERPYKTKSNFFMKSSLSG